MADPSCAGNATTLAVAGIIYANEGNDVEALKACHSGLSLEMCVSVARISQLIAAACVLPKKFKIVMVCLVLCRMALSVQLYLKIDRVDQAEKQLKVSTLLMIATIGCRMTRALEWDILMGAVWCRQCLLWMMMPL